MEKQIHLPGRFTNNGVDAAAMLAGAQQEQLQHHDKNDHNQHTSAGSIFACPPQSLTLCRTIAFVLVEFETQNEVVPALHKVLRRQ